MKDYFGPIEEDAPEPKPLRLSTYEGLRFGSWLVGKRITKKSPRYYCTCDCGRTEIRHLYSLRHRSYQCTACHKVSTKDSKFQRI